MTTTCTGRRHGERLQWSLTDCTSFIIMRDNHLRDALTADHHFVQARFHRADEVIWE
jgi:predicted nucleic acid-binding protein